MSPENTPSASAPEPLTPSARRVRRLSRSLVWLFTALLGLAVLYAVALIIVAVCFPDHITRGGGEMFLNRDSQAIAGLNRLSGLPATPRLAGATAALVRTVPWLFILWHLRRLFQIYAAGAVFSADSAAQLKRIGMGLIAAPAAVFAGNLMFRLAGGAEATWFSVAQLQTLVSGAIVFAIAQVMDLGHEIEQEKDSFI